MGFWEVLQSYFAANASARFIAILVLVVLIVKLVLWFFKKVVERQLERANKPVQEKIVVKLETPIILIIILAGLEIAARQIRFTYDVFGQLVDSLIIAVTAYMFIGVMDILLNYWDELHKHERHEFVHGEMIPLLRSLAKITFSLIAIVLVLQTWGVQVGALVASLGILGIILGFAFQDTMKNIFGGISLTMDNSITKGDIVELESGETGEIMEINFRSTKIKTFNNDTLIVPNGTLANEKFHNYAQPNKVLRVVIPVNVAYGSDVAKVREVLLETIKEDENILVFPQREVRFMEMADYSLRFDFIFFIKNYHDRFQMINTVTEKAYNALREHNIEIPFPTRTLHMRKD